MPTTKFKSKLKVKPKSSSKSNDNPRRSSQSKNILRTPNNPSKIISFIKNNKKLVGAGLVTSFFGGLTSYNLLKRQNLKKIVNECKNDLTLNCFENANKKYTIKLTEKELKIILDTIVMYSKDMDIDTLLKDLNLV